MYLLGFCLYKNAQKRFVCSSKVVCVGLRTAFLSIIGVCVGLCIAVFPIIGVCVGLWWFVHFRRTLDTLL